MGRFARGVCLFFLFALETATLLHANPTCRVDIGTPWELSAVMPAGPHKGECLETSSRRPVVILKPEHAAQLRRIPGSTLFANFYHNKKFLIAEVSPQVDSVVYQIDHFPKSPIPAAHTMLKAHTHINTYEQSWPLKSDVLQTLDSLHLSAEAVGIAHWKFDLFKGFQNEFALVMRALSSDEMAKIKLDQHRRKVEQILLNLLPEESSALTHGWLQTSHQKGYSEMYHTFLKNCDTVALCQIDSAVAYRGIQKVAKQLGSTLDFYPPAGKISVQSRGLNAGQLPTWDQERLMDQNACQKSILKMLQNAQKAPQNPKP